MKKVSSDLGKFKAPDSSTLTNFEKNIYDKKMVEFILYNHTSEACLYL